MRRHALGVAAVPVDAFATAALAPGASATAVVRVTRSGARRAEDFMRIALSAR